MQYACFSDVGLTRKNNEDSVIVNDDLGLFIVADGMGGYNGGETASRTAVQIVEDYFVRYWPEWQDKQLSAGTGPDDEYVFARAQTGLKTAILQANEEIFRIAQQDSSLANMGTTITAAYVDEIDYRVALAHVGDSRAYLLREGQLSQLTKDHSLVGELLDEGAITPAEAIHHPQRNVITRAVGADRDLAVDDYQYDLQEYDILLLCSDGFYGGCSNEDLADKVTNALKKAGGSIAEASSFLMDDALQRGGQDNISLILIQL